MFVTNKADWITLKEIPKFIRSVIWLSQASDFAQAFGHLGNNISSMVKTNGFDFTFHYLKECHRLCIMYIGGTPSHESLSRVRVKVNRYGLPVKLPYSLRLLLEDKQNSNLIQGVLTALSIFRVFRTTVKPDLSTITSEFSGQTRTLEIESTVRRFMKGSSISFGRIRGFISESVGPIRKRATVGAGIDAIALLPYPLIAFSVVRLLISRKAYLYTFSLFGIWLLTGPLYLIMVSCGLRGILPIGKLGVVYDQAGKARIVAMVNWWIQLSLLGLHNSIFDWLRTLETDGTFNQSAPLQRLLVNRLPDHHFYSFDLSAATDRLPIDLQVQILNTLGVNGDLWRNLLDIPYSYKGELIRYSVGQPMGAFSSWAMLALTHHVLVQYSAKLAGLETFNHYAVLGDDIVINHNEVASQYLHVMKLLGVSINPNKSVISYEVVEFAKRVVTPSVDLTPIGPGAILAHIRTPALIGSLFRELNEKSLSRNFDLVHRLIQTAPEFTRRVIWLGLWANFGVRGLLATRQLDMRMLSWITYGRSIDPLTFRYSLYNGIKTAVIQRARKAILRNQLEETAFYKKVFQEFLKIGIAQGLMDALSFVLSPAPWIYFESLVRQTEKSREFEQDLHDASQTSEGILYLLESQPFLGISYRWNKRAAKELNSFLRDCDREIWQTYDEMFLIHGADGPGYY